MQTVTLDDNLLVSLGRLIIFSRKSKKIIINLSSAEFAQSLLIVNFF